MTEITREFIANPWIVDRHGGRYSDTYKVRAVGPDEASVRPVFDKIKRDLRQGEVRLLDPTGKIVDRCWAPCARVHLG
jgi:hypothetical protein